MRFRMSFAGSALCLIGLAFPASSQTSSASNSTSQVSKTWEIGWGLADQLDPFVRLLNIKIPGRTFSVIMCSELRIELLRQQA